MKRVYAWFLLCGLSLSVVAQEAARPSVTNILDRYKAELSEPNVKTYLSVINKQRRLSAEGLEKMRETLELGLLAPVRLTEDAAPLKSSATAFAGACRKQADTNLIAFVVLVDVPEAEVPMMLTALDGRWAVVNVAALGTLKGDEAVTRTAQVAFRAFASLLGAGYSKDPRSLMVPISGAKDLALLSHNLEPKALAACGFWGDRFGLAKITGRSGFKRKLVAGEVPPANPDRWEAWEKRTGKKARPTFEKLGYNPDEIAAAYRAREKSQKP